MQPRVTRPDIRKPDQYMITLDETMLLWLEDGVQEKVNHLYDSVAAHSGCDLRNETGCKVRESQLIEKYGSLANATGMGRYVTDCSEDLMFIHGQLGDLMSFLFQCRYIRNSISSRGAFELDDATQLLTAVKGEVAHREEAGLEQTDELPSIEQIQDLSGRVDGDGKRKS